MPGDQFTTAGLCRTDLNESDGVLSDAKAVTTFIKPGEISRFSASFRKTVTPLCMAFMGKFMVCFKAV